MFFKARYGLFATDGKGNSGWICSWIYQKDVSLAYNSYSLRWPSKSLGYACGIYEDILWKWCPISEDINEI